MISTELEKRILESFEKKTKGEFKDLDLIVSLPDEEGWQEEHYCAVMETKDNGRVWDCECTKTGNIKSIWEL